MKNRMKKVVVALLIAGTALTSVPSGILAAQPYVRVLHNAQEGVKALHTTKAHLSGFRMTRATQKEEIMRRVIVDTKQVPKDTYGAGKIFYYKGGKHFILEYNSAASAKKAVDKLRDDYPEANIAQDQPVYIEEMEGVKKVKTKDGEIKPKIEPVDGAKIMGLDKLKKSMENEHQIIKVAVIDSGIDKGHPWFKDRIDTENSINFGSYSKDQPEQYDDNPKYGGHGTHVSGIITQSTPKNVKIMAIRVFDITGTSSIETISMGVDHGREHGADIYNMSLGHNSPTQAEVTLGNTALRNVVNTKGTICVASGNENTDVAYCYPASSALVISCGSIRPDKDSKDGFVHSEFSNKGKRLDFVAPGEMILSAWPYNPEYPGDRDTQAVLSGTSMATPYLSAAAAYIKMKHKDYNQWDVYASLQDYTKDIGAKGKDDLFGYGYIDMSDYMKDGEPSRKHHQAIVTDPSISGTMNDVGKEIAIDAKLSKGDGALSYSSTDSSVAKVTGNKVKIVGAGECEITVTAKGTDKYLESKRQVQLEILKGQQDIAVAKKSYKIPLNEKKVKLKAKIKAPGDGKLTFVANESSVAKIKEDGTVIPRKKGTVLVYAIASSTKNYDRYVSDAIKVSVVAAKKPAKIGKVKKFKAKAVKKAKVTFSWKKMKGVTGYQIEYAKGNGKFKALKTVKSAKTFTMKSKALKKGKKYTFRIRAYKVVKGKKVTGSFVKTKVIKLK